MVIKDRIMTKALIISVVSVQIEIQIVFFLEDEELFMFHCKAYDDLRSKCKVLSANVRVNLDLCSLLSTENEEAIPPLAKFIAEASAVWKKKLNS